MSNIRAFFSQLLAFFAVFFLLLNLTYSMRILSNLHYRKLANVADKEIEMSSYIFRFDTDVYIQHGYPHCHDLERPKWADTPGEYCYYDGKNCDDLPQNCVKAAPFCHAKNFVLIENFDQPFSKNISLSPNEEYYILFHYTEKDYEHFFFFETLVEYGDPQMAIYPDSAYFDKKGKYSFSTPAFGPEVATLCPGSNEPHQGILTPGTILVLLTCNADSRTATGPPGSNFTINISRHSLNNKNPVKSTKEEEFPPPSITVDKYNNNNQINWIKLKDGESVKYEYSKKNYYHFFYFSKKSEKCINYYWDYAGSSIFFTNDRNTLPMPNNGYTATDIHLMSYIGGPKSGFLYLCPNEQNEIFLAIRVTQRNYFDGPPDNYFNGKILLDSSTNLRYRRRLADVSYYQAVFDMLMSVTLIYNGPDTSITKRVCNYPISGTEKSECERLWYYAPSEAANPFYPLASWMYGDFSLTHIQQINAPARDPRVFNFASLISHKEKGSAKITVLEIDKFPLYLVKFMGTLVDENGNYFESNPMSPTLLVGITYCSYPILNNIINSVLEKLLMLSQRDYKVSNNYRFDIDYDLQSLNYSACVSMSNYLINLGNRTNLISSTLCMNDNDVDDPCCYSLSWQGPNCVPRMVNVTSPLFMEISSFANEVCETSLITCINLYSFEYQTSINNRNTLYRCDYNIPNRIEYFRKVSYPFYKYKTKYFGENALTGITCSNDDVCKVVVSTSTCNMVTRRCKFEMDEVINKFLNEFLFEIDLLLYVFLQNAYNIDVPYESRATEESIKKWKEALSILDCTSKHSMGYPHRKTYVRRVNSINEKACAVGAYTGGYKWPCMRTYCSDIYCTLPFICQSNFSWVPECYYVTEVTDSIPNCEYKNCNWFNKYENGMPVPTTNEQECLEEPYSCRACDNEEKSLCFNLGLAESECSEEKKVVCLLNNKNYQVESPGFDCSIAHSCDIKCHDENGKEVECNDKESCVNTGVCGDAEYFVDGITSVCRGDPKPFWGMCDRLNGAYGVPSPFGCLYYGIEISDCESYGLTTMKKANNKEECDKYGNGCLEFLSIGNIDNYMITTLKKEADCLETGLYSRVVSLGNWKSGVWAPAHPLKIEWGENKFESKYFQGKTLDLLGLSIKIQDSIERIYNNKQNSLYLCEYYHVAKTVAPLACSCTLDGIRDESCFRTGTSTPISDRINGMYHICPGDLDKYYSPPFLFNFNSKTLESCQNFTTYLFESTLYASSDTQNVNTFILDFSIDYSYKITNSWNMVVGSLIGDGFSISAGDKSITSINDVRVCFVTSERLSNLSAGFDIFDIAYSEIMENEDASDISKLYLMNLTAKTSVENEIMVCTNFSEVHFNRIYYPCKRVEDATISYITLPWYDLLFYVIICSLYWISFLIAFYKFFYILVNGYLSYQNIQAWTFLTIAIMLCMRGIYTLLILFGELTTKPSFATSFVLLEIPLFLFIFVICFFIILWVSLIRIRRTLSRRSSRNTFWIMCISLFGFFLVLTVSLLVSYELTRKEPYAACGGKMKILDTLPLKIISTIYRSIIFFICILLSSILIVTGLQLYFRMIQLNRNTKQKHRKKIFWLSIVCSFCLEMLSIIMISFGLTSYTNNYLGLSLMAVFEITPCMVIIGVLWKSKKEDVTQSMTFTHTEASQQNVMIPVYHNISQSEG